MSNPTEGARRRQADVDTANILNQLSYMEKRADERHAALLATLNDHEERLRILERGQQRGVLADGGSYLYATVVGLVQYLMHKGP